MIGPVFLRFLGIQMLHWLELQKGLACLASKLWHEVGHQIIRLTPAAVWAAQAMMQ